VAPKIGRVIPNPVGSGGELVALAVEHSGSPLGDRLRPAPEPLHVACSRCRPGVPDEVGDVLQRLVAVREQRRDADRMAQEISDETRKDEGYADGLPNVERNTLNLCKPSRAVPRRTSATQARHCCRWRTRQP